MPKPTSEITVKSLLITGRFSEVDLLFLTATFRLIERRNPTTDFLFAILDDDLTMDQATELIKRIFPSFDDNEPDIRVLDYTIDVVYQGATYAMTTATDIKSLLDQYHLAMTKGTIEIAGSRLTGVAKLEDGVYQFTADEQV